MTILVTGGTGVLGREVVSRLRARGAQEVRVLTHRPATAPGMFHADLNTAGDPGLAEAVDGVQTIVHCATSGDWRRPWMDAAQTRNLLAAAARAEHPHIVYISIVGVDRMRFSYYRGKLASERLIESSGLPWTTLRATQFHDLILVAVHALAKPPIALVPRQIPFQPVEVGEVADRLTALASADPVGRAPDFGGPEVRSLEEFLRIYQSISGRHRPVLRIPLPGRAAAEFRAGHHLLGVGAQHGQRTFEEYLRARWSANRTLTPPYARALR